MSKRNEKILNEIRKRRFYEIQQMSEEEKIKREWQLLLDAGLSENDIMRSVNRCCQEV